MKLKKIDHPHFKWELEEDYTITPRFDQDFWSTLNIKTDLADIIGGKIKYKSGSMSNGLTKHKDHKAYLKAAHGHDVLLCEGYAKDLFADIPREYKDRVFLGMMLDDAKTKIDVLKAYIHYWPVRLYSMIKG